MTRTKKCTLCNGAGQITKKNDSREAVALGLNIGDTCTNCNGTGHIKSDYFPYTISYTLNGKDKTITIP